MDNAEDAVEQAIDVVSLVAWLAGGAFVGVMLAVFLLVAMKILTRKSRVMARLLRRTRAPFIATIATVGAGVGFGLHDVGQDYAWFSTIQHTLLLTVITFVGWYLFSWANVFQDMADFRTEKDLRDSQRLQTQAQVFRRVLQTVIVIATLLAALLTFPAMRAPLASLLASAGVLSVVMGLAAQSTIGNMFAGMQLAFTDAIRVGDTVTAMMSAKEQTGTIEEITLTYVVIRMWNNRRVLLPSSEFTSKPFENWTRASTDQLGAVELNVDWNVPLARVRQQVETILLESKEWDHRVWNVQMTNSIGTSVTLRIIVSAANPADRWDLECHVRERLIGWICDEIPWALPRSRSVPEDVREVNRDVSAERVAELAADLSRIAGPDTADNPPIDPAEPQEPEEISQDPVHAARLRASRKRAQRARRRSVFQRSVRLEVEEGHPPATLDHTMVITDPTMIAQSSPPERGSRMYSGSPDAQKLRSLYDGPGEEVIRKREETIQMQALDAQGLATPTSKSAPDQKG